MRGYSDSERFSNLKVRHKMLQNSKDVNKKELDDIIYRINQLQKSKSIKDKIHIKFPSAWNIATDILGGVIVGMVIGYFCDKMFDSRPLFFIICLCLGIIASGKTIWQKLNDRTSS